MRRPATYWHMLPEYAQARKAIWNAVDPHTGKRRIDIAFPQEIRENVNESEMFIRFKGGSTYQLVGSDSYNKLVGASVRGIVASEWALADPAAWAFMSPILGENNGWALFISTPRGRNHFYKMFESAKKNPDHFAQLLTVSDTKFLSEKFLTEDLITKKDLFGDDEGLSLWQQEYLCSWDAELLGSYYGKLISAIENDGRIQANTYNPLLPVHTGWDIGFSDDTSIWFFQVYPKGGLVMIDHYNNHGKDILHYAEVIHERGYKYGSHYLPHDAFAQNIHNAGRCIAAQLNTEGLQNIKQVKKETVTNGIYAVKRVLKKAFFDQKCETAIESLRNYQREYDADRKCFKDKPLHDWTSHDADAMRSVALGYEEIIERQPPAPTTDLELFQGLRSKTSTRHDDRI